MEMFKKIVFFDALSEEAKEKAREWYRDGNDMPYLEEYLKEFIQEELEQREYKVKELKPLYSLSNCQGDGVSFTATLEKNGGRFHAGRRENEPR